METSVMVVTPEMAMRWLGSNNNNRRIRKSYVRVLAEAMERGEWELNGESIKLSKSGELLDGQHRLRAVIQSNRAIQTVVAAGLGNVFATIDTGARRTTSDVLGINGEKRTVLLAAICKMLYQSIRGNYAARPTHREVLKTLEENPKIRESLGFVAGYSHFKGISMTALAFIHFLGVCSAPTKKKEIEEFINKVLTGEECKKGEPALTLRNRLIRASNDGGARMEETKIWIWKALCYHLNGATLNRIKINEGERLPDFETMLSIIDMAGRS